MKKLLLLLVMLSFLGCAQDKGMGVIIKVTEAEGDNPWRSMTVIELQDGSRVSMSGVWGEEGDSVRVWRHFDGMTGHRTHN